MHLAPPIGLYDHCGQLLLGKISKIGATRCRILRLKCYYWLSSGAPPEPAVGQRSPAVFKEPCSKGTEGGGGEGRDLAHPKILAWVPMCLVSQDKFMATPMFCEFLLTVRTAGFLSVNGVIRVQGVECRGFVRSRLQTAASLRTHLV